MMVLSLGSIALLVGLGILGGALSAVAGMGGGLFLILALGATAGPHAALASTSPALFFSNAHRAYLFRAHVDGHVALRFAMGAVPAAAAGAIVAARFPPALVHCAMIGLALFAIARSLGWVHYAPSPRTVLPVSALIGVLAAAAGGAGFLVGPLLMALGLTGARYAGTIALCAVLLHGARIVGYRAGGLLTSAYVGASAVLLVGLVLGNYLGRRLRDHLTPKLEQRVEVGAIAVATVLGLLGFR